ncbi:MAG: hypothetical protein HYX82_02555 [Chloroflexi bacterium]|nr:hypothetical protein [Chloroflexota bacterium]
MPRYPVTMEVKEIREDLPPTCPVQKVGDKVVIDNGCFEGKVCLPVLAQQVARLYGLVNGMASANTITYRCPDKGKVVYEIRRDPDNWWKDALSRKTKSEVKPHVP